VNNSSASSSRMISLTSTERFFEPFRG
jgi:hypothetical protein